MKKVIIILVSISILFTLLLAISYYENKQKQELPETTLQKSFNVSGANVVSSEIYFWSRLTGKNKNFENLKLLASDLSKGLGIIDNNYYSKDLENNDLIQKIELRGTTGSGKMVNMKIQLSKNSVNTGESFVSVSISQDLSNTGLEETRKSVLSVFRNYGIDPKVNSSMTGNFSGKLDQSRLNSISNRIMKEVKATNIEGIRDGNLISVSAYSPFITESVKVKGNRINLNMAIRYNSCEDKTYIWLATPIITTEY